MRVLKPTVQKLRLIHKDLCTVADSFNYAYPTLEAWFQAFIDDEEIDLSLIHISEPTRPY